MKTWLDELTKKAGEVARDGKVNAGVASRSLEFDFTVLQTIAARAACRERILFPFGSLTEHGFYGALLPLLVPPDTFGVPPYACAVNSSLVQQFVGATASPEVIRHAQEFIASRPVIYVDVADRALRIGNEHHLKALVISHVAELASFAPRPKGGSVEQSPALRFFASFGRIGEFADNRIGWYAGGGASNDFFCWAIENLRNVSDLYIKSILAEIEQFAWLTMAYAAIAAPAARRAIPQIDSEERLREDRATRRNARRFSLFKIERLSEPADGFGSGAGGKSKEEWQLGRRIGVRGHYKMQPYGPEKRWRKLIFVKRHMRGLVTAPPLHTMSAL
jgi:hypothetical protein